MGGGDIEGKEGQNNRKSGRILKNRDPVSKKGREMPSPRKRESSGYFGGGGVDATSANCTAVRGHPVRLSEGEAQGENVRRAPLPKADSPSSWECGGNIKRTRGFSSPGEEEGGGEFDFGEEMARHLKEYDWKTRGKIHRSTGKKRGHRERQRGAST